MQYTGAKYHPDLPIETVANAYVVSQPAAANAMFKQSFGCQYHKVHLGLFVRASACTAWPKIKIFANCCNHWNQRVKYRAENISPKKLFQLFMMRREERWRVHSSLQRELYSRLMDAHFIDNEWEMHSYAPQTRGMHGTHAGANRCSERCTHLWACRSAAVPEEHAYLRVNWNVLRFT